MRTKLLLALATTLIFAGCGGGGSAGGPALAPGSGVGGGGGSPSSTQSVSENAINTENAFGSPVKSIGTFNSSVSSAAVMMNGRAVPQSASGTCNSGVEFFAPDKNGDPNSTEKLDFYDTACTQLARDTVRIYTQNGTSETDNRTVKIYAINNSTPSAVRTDSVSISNATFDQYGYPVVATGFDRSSTGELDIAGSKTIASGDELVMMPGNNGVNTFCGDSAGYNATGIASLNETFGWQGGALAGGTRTVNSDGSVTWATTHAGSTFKGAIGSLSLGAGVPNTTCPITTPEYTLVGGTQGGSYSIPVTATYLHGILTNLTVTNATLANGNTLNVTTNTGVSPTSSTFITGIVSNNGTQIATFSVDAFGDGTLTITSSGAQFVINDWHVVK